MRSTFLLLFLSTFLSNSFAQSGCLDEWKKIFEKRGSYSVSDDMHRKVYISFVEGGESSCFLGKARVENGRVVSIFLQFEDGTYELMDMKLLNKAGKEASVTNGISEEIINERGERLYVIFVDKLRPAKREYKSVGGPGDL